MFVGRKISWCIGLVSSPQGAQATSILFCPICVAVFHVGSSSKVFR